MRDESCNPRSHESTGWTKRSVPINVTKQNSDRASKTGDRLIFAKKTAKKNLSPQTQIVPINSSEFLIFFEWNSAVRR